MLAPARTDLSGVVADCATQGVATVADSADLASYAAAAWASVVAGLLRVERRDGAGRRREPRGGRSSPTSRRASTCRMAANAVSVTADGPALVIQRQVVGGAVVETTVLVAHAGHPHRGRARSGSVPANAPGAATVATVATSIHPEDLRARVARSLRGRAATARALTKAKVVVGGA